MKEIWKDVDGYEGLYRVSNFGRVIGPKGKILKQSIKQNGYKQVTLCRNGSRKSALVHRIVADAFVDNDMDKPQVNHLDGDKGNNNCLNLEWTTPSENQLHSYANGFAEGIKGEDRADSKLTREDVWQIRSIYENGWFFYHEIADAYGVSKGCIQSVVNRRNWRHI